MCNSNQRYSSLKTFQSFYQNITAVIPSFCRCLACVCIGLLFLKHGFCGSYYIQYIEEQVFFSGATVKMDFKIYLSEYLFCALQLATSGHVVVD